jgi:hypothetical protein
MWLKKLTYTNIMGGMGCVLCRAKNVITFLTYDTFHFHLESIQSALHDGPNCQQKNEASSSDKMNGAEIREEVVLIFHHH